MNNDRATVLERLTLAAGGRGDIEVVRALGGAEAAIGLVPRELERVLGISRRSVGGLAAVTEVGAQLTRLQAETGLPAEQALESIRVLTARLNMVRGWRLSEQQIQRVARCSLQLHRDPTCPHCQGRRYELQPGVPSVSARICRPCSGTGQRPYPKRHGDKVEAVMNVLGWIQGVMEKAVARRLG